MPKTREAFPRWISIANRCRKKSVDRGSPLFRRRASPTCLLLRKQNNAKSHRMLQLLGHATKANPRTQHCIVPSSLWFGCIYVQTREDLVHFLTYMQDLGRFRCSGRNLCSALLNRAHALQISRGDFTLITGVDWADLFCFIVHIISSVANLESSAREGQGTLETEFLQSYRAERERFDPFLNKKPLKTCVSLLKKAVKFPKH